MLLREWHGLSYGEIAQHLGRSVDAVGALIFRARRTLSAELARTIRDPSLRGLVLLGVVLRAFKTSLGGGAAKVATISVVIGASTCAAPYLNDWAHDQSGKTTRSYEPASAVHAGTTPRLRVNRPEHEVPSKESKPPQPPVTRADDLTETWAHPVPSVDETHMTEPAEAVSVPTREDDRSKPGEDLHTETLLLGELSRQVDELLDTVSLDQVSAVQEAIAKVISEPEALPNPSSLTEDVLGAVDQVKKERVSAGT
jgi:hypothetical protein